MPGTLECLHMNHINAMVEDYDTGVDHLRELYGAEFNLDLPGDQWHACLITIGGVMFEVFAPHQYLLHARFAPHYVGIEYQIPDVDHARKAVLARGGRVIRELGSAIHAHPAEMFGVAWEFFDRSFHADPPPVQYIEPLKSAELWAQHPLGYKGLKRYSVAVADIDAASKFFEDFLGAAFLYREERPTVEGKSVGFTLGDTVVELITPTGPGKLERYLARYGDGIRSTVFAVRDLEQARSYFAERGVTLGPGDAPDALAVAPEDNLGLLFEFSE